MDSFAIFIAKVDRPGHKILVDLIFDRSFPAEFVCFEPDTADLFRYTNERYASSVSLRHIVLQKQSLITRNDNINIGSSAAI